jgi:hypothetical protein
MNTKIVVIVRTRDEEHRIANFCKAYEDADMVLVGDGGSVDDTIKIAKSFPNVKVIHYKKKVFLDKGYWRNNDSDHTNWLIKKATKYKPDWIISDDCDCRPNYLLKKDYRKILSETSSDVVMAVRFYVWGLNEHFPHMAKPEEEHKRYETSLWAWRGDLDLYTVDVPPAFTFRIGEKDIKDFREDTDVLELFPPYALIHYSWDDETRVMKKIKVYRQSGLIPNQLHPLHFAGPLEPKPEFLHE